eukprot:scaffold5820_cov192-Ochromonas_danica.AAC.1
MITPSETHNQRENLDWTSGSGSSLAACPTECVTCRPKVCSSGNSASFWQPATVAGKVRRYPDLLTLIHLPPLTLFLNVSLIVLCRGGRMCGGLEGVPSPTPPPE